MQQLEARIAGSGSDGHAPSELDTALIERAAAELVNPEDCDLELELPRVMEEEDASMAEEMEQLFINKRIARGDISSKHLDRLLAESSDADTAMDEVANVVVGNSVVEDPAPGRAFDLWVDGATTGSRILRERLTALDRTPVGFNRRFICSWQCFDHV